MALECLKIDGKKYKIIYSARGARKKGTGSDEIRNGIIIVYGTYVTRGKGSGGGLVIEAVP